MARLNRGRGVALRALPALAALTAMAWADVAIAQAPPGSTGRIRVALRDFDNVMGRPEHAKFGRALVEMLTTDLESTGRLQLFERERLDRVLAEQKLQHTEHFDKSTVVELGKLTGIAYLISGSITAGGKDKLRIDARLTDATTGEVVLTARVMSTTDGLFEAEEELAERLKARLMPAARGGAPTPPPRGPTVAARSVDRGVLRRAAARSADPGKIYARSHAVVIGIDAYPRLTPLKAGVADARAVAGVLRGRGFEVTTLLDGQATLRRIRQVLSHDLYEAVGPQDRVLVFFAGHGQTHGPPDREMGYLMPFDADPIATSGISMSELQKWFALYQAKHVMFVADACYSGLAVAERAAGLAPGTRDYLARITSKPVRVALVAGQRDQKALEEGGQGVFTRFFLDALAGAGDVDRDGLITSDEIAVFVKRRVSQHVWQRHSRRQDPKVAAEGDGEFVFFVGGDRAATR